MATPLPRREILKAAATIAGSALAAPALLGLAAGGSGCKTAASASSQAVPRQAPRDRRRYEELLPAEFYEEQRRMPVVYLPIGAMEEHGLQCPLATDPWQAYEICLRTARRQGGIVHPIVPIAPAGHPSWSRAELRSGTKEINAPSVWVSCETCRTLYLELLESFADLGFRVCMAFSGHWPGDDLLQQLEQETGGGVRGMRFWGGGTVRILKDMEEPPAIAGHGMMSETSLVMAINPRWVDLDRVSRIATSPISHQLKNQPAAHLDAIRTANAGYGNQRLDRAAERLADLARALLQAP